MMVPGHLLLQKERETELLNHHDLQDPRTSCLSQTSSYQDQFSQFQSNKYVSDETLSTLNLLEDPFFLTASTTLPTLPSFEMDWTDLSLSNYSYPSTRNYYNYSSANSNHQDMYTSGFETATIYSSAPAWQEPCDSRMMEDFALGDAITSHSPKHTSPSSLLNSPKVESFTQDGSRGFSRLSISRSPTTESSPPSAPDATYKMAEDDDEDDLKASNPAGEDRSSDEPYAKLIYRALLEAPNHSMVLQEIYQWFIDNTDKGSSSSSGWRNSIRHNLSMNAAFRKTDRQTSGDDTKKTSEWVLEPFAIKNGVTPTTRYRKTGKKGTKSEHPMPSRQISGRKGGICTKNKLYKPKTKDEHHDVAGINGRHSGKRSHARLRKSMSSDHRQLSPTTPLPVSDMTEQYNVKPAPFEEILESPEYTLADVSGLYNEGGAIFCHDSGANYSNHAVLWPNF